jgi:enterochelin esterase-like enzyme
MVLNILKGDKMQSYKSLLITALLIILFISIISNAQEIGGPYTTDENTVLLMHFDGNLTNNSTLSSDGVSHGSGISFIANTLPDLGQCLKIDNRNASNKSYISIPHNESLNLSQSWTIEAWFYLNSIGTNSAINPTIVSKATNGEANYFLWYHDSWGSLKGQFSNSDNKTTYIAIGNNSITTGKWFHTEYTRNSDNSTHKLIIRNENKEIIAENEYQYDLTQATPVLSVEDLLIGSLSALDNFYFDGYIDELRISNIVRPFTPLPPPPFPEELDQVRVEKKVNAFNLHQMKYDNSPYNLTIDVISSTEYDTQKPSDALAFDCGYVNGEGWVYVSEPTTAAQMEVFNDIDQAAIYYMCQSFLKHYYESTEMPLWFKTGFAAYESDMRFDDSDIKIAYNNYGVTLTSFDALNNSTTFVENNGLAIAYLFGEFMGVYTPWKYFMINEVNASTIIPASWWENVESIDKLFAIWLRYFDVRILESTEQNRVKLGKETEHFKFYYREAEDLWAAYFPDILEAAILEYIDLYDFDVYEKFSYITMPECDFAEINDVDCINRYTGGTAWSSGLSSTSPDNSNDFDRFRKLIRHELGHLTQAHFPANDMTAWINEGSAQFISHGPLSQAEIDVMQTLTEDDINQATSYFGHLPTFEDTKVYPGASNVDYYSLGEIMINFVYESGGYGAVKEIIMDHETAIANLGYSSAEDYMDAYYNYVNIRFLKIVPQNGTLSNNKIIESTNLGYACQYRVYTPASYNSESDLPTIYVTDGQNYLSNSMGKMVTTLDDLIANDIIKPIIAVFLDPRDPNNLSNDRRGMEYRNNINFVNYVTQELIPIIDASYKTNSSANTRAIMGASYGAYNAAYFCVKASNYFNNFGMNSSYLHPNGDYNIDSDLLATNLNGMKLYLSYGTQDSDGERYFNRLKSIFDQKGKEFEFDIVNDGHTWTNWSSLVDNALHYFFPNSVSPPFVDDIPNQTIFEGNVFTSIQLDNFASVSNNDDSQIAWSFNGNVELTIEVDTNRVATIFTPDENWSGRETIKFIATNTYNASTSKEVTFLVIPVNDYPIITGAPELIEFVSDTSYTINIWQLASDVETDTDLLTYEFNIELDSIFYSFNDGTGLLTLSSEIEFGGEGDLSWSVSDTEADIKDTIHIVVDKAVVIGIDDQLLAPEEYVLHQNYPNPFNPSTMIKYGVPEQSNIRIEVFNMLGQSVGLLINSEKSAGYYETAWNAANLPSGIYLISIRAEGSISKKNFSQSRKALLIK